MESRPTRDQLLNSRVTYVSERTTAILPPEAERIRKFPNDFTKQLVTVRLQRYESAWASHYYVKIVAESNPFWSDDRGFDEGDSPKPGWIHQYGDPITRGEEFSRKFDYLTESIAYAMGVLEGRGWHKSTWHRVDWDDESKLLSAYELRDSATYLEYDPMFYFATRGTVTTADAPPKLDYEDIVAINKKLKEKYIRGE